MQRDSPYFYLVDRPQLDGSWLPTLITRCPAMVTAELKPNDRLRVHRGGGLDDWVCIEPSSVFCNRLFAKPANK